ncbi:MAG TPA: type VI secretion system baseplate subunit TssG [Steroidobacter sp.]|uniref:type VI secretion system baseplate subunit TssG n=1 Tax=Steroidobacter sp. TaxID=1978227 RepID=UPI002ED77D4C
MPTLDLNAPIQPLAELQSRPHGYTLFAALRLLEQVFAANPRLGEARKAGDDAVRLGQAPHLSFAPCDVAQLEHAEDGTLHLEQFAFGLFGPNGALPLHLTELAYERRRHKDDATIVDFLNLFQHRLISLFYRAWAESEPAVSLDRPDSDRFRTYVGALIGLAPESARDADSTPDYAKLSRAGLFAAQPRSAEGLEAVLADYFGIDVEVRQFIGSWMEIPDDLRCRLGGREAAALGSNATLGAATWQCQHKFEIVLGPLPHATFKNFLPGAPGLAELHSLLRLYTNDEWEWQVRLLLREVDIPGARLDGASPLGWTSWLGERRSHAADVVIQESAAR